MSTPGLGLGGATATDPQAQYKYQLAVALARIKSGASWFNWIAILSVINALIVMFSGGGAHTIQFVVGLGITQIVNFFAVKSGSGVGLAAGLVVTLFIAGFFLLMGRLSTQGRKWALVLGIVIYALDALLMFALQDWLALAFHGYALFMLSRAFSAINMFEQAKQQAANNGVFLGT